MKYVLKDSDSGKWFQKSTMIGPALTNDTYKAQTYEDKDQANIAAGRVSNFVCCFVPEPYESGIAGL